MDMKHLARKCTAEVIPFPATALPPATKARVPQEDRTKKIIQFRRKLSAKDELIEALARLAIEQVELERWSEKLKDLANSDDAVAIVTQQAIITIKLLKTTNESGLAIDQLTSLARSARSAKTRELALWSVSFRWFQACHQDPDCEQERQALTDDWQDLRGKLMELSEHFDL